MNNQITRNARIPYSENRAILKLMKGNRIITEMVGKQTGPFRWELV